MSLLSVSVMARRLAQHDLSVYFANVYYSNVYCVNVYNIILHGICMPPSSCHHASTFAVDKRLGKAERRRYFDDGSPRTSWRKVASLLAGAQATTFSTGFRAEPPVCTVPVVFSRGAEPGGIPVKHFTLRHSVWSRLVSNHRGRRTRD